MAIVTLKKLGKHQRIIAVLIILMASGMLVASVMIGQQFTNISEEAPAKTLPKYQTLLPVDKTIEQLGEWGSFKSPSGDTIFNFTDTIDGVRINVAEQLLPDSYKTDVNSRVRSIAQDFYATDKIVLDDTTAYMGTSSKGPQWVILSRNSLLIIIKSEKNIKLSSWQSYVKNLNSISNTNVPKF